MQTDNLTVFNRTTQHEIQNTKIGPRHADSKSGLRFIVKNGGRQWPWLFGERIAGDRPVPFLPTVLSMSRQSEAVC
jgi:hypothetical protein